MKKISCVIPTYNEINNLIDGYNRVKKVLTERLTNYEYEILFIDNFSNDGTKEALEKIAATDKNVKLIFNSRNVGWAKSSYYGLLNTTGDCAILLAADMQEPPEKIPDFIKYWEEGYKVVVGKKNKSNESRIMYWLRGCFYKFMDITSDVHQIHQFMGFGLYDREFIDLLKNLNEPLPYFRGMVAEMGVNIKEIDYTQDVRRKGKTHFNLIGIYDLAMLGITSYSKKFLRLCTIIGAILLMAIFCAFITISILKVLRIYNKRTIKTISQNLFSYFLMSLQLFFLGMSCEYLLNINERVMKHPLVVEEKRVNF